MNRVEDAYKAYLKDNNKCLAKGDEQYFRIVYKECFSLSNIGRELFIILPMNMFQDRRTKLIEDENGNRFELEGPELIRFKDEIPEWYMNCLAFTIMKIDSVDKIGEYAKATCDLSE